MELKKWTHYKVSRKGKVRAGGTVEVDFSVTNTIDNPVNCICCNKSKLQWIAINLGRQANGSVYGVTFFFKTKSELIRYITSN